jgi:acetyl esterase/lipase
MRELKSRVVVALRVLVVLWLLVQPETARGQSGLIGPARPPEQADPLEVVHRDLAYRPESAAEVVGFERCRLDLACPRDNSGFATVVWFHGGGLSKGNRELPASLRGHGVAIAGAGYRLHPDVESPAYIEDAAAAVAWVLKNIEQYGGDPRRVVVAGHSAGGYLTMMLGLDPRWLQPHGLSPDRLAGLAPLSGQAITHFTIRKERGIAETQPVIDDLAPLFHVKKSTPPILLVTGDRQKELLGRYEENAYLWRMFREVEHGDVELLELQGYNHGEMAEPAFPLVLKFVNRVTAGKQGE